MEAFPPPKQLVFFVVNFVALQLISPSCVFMLTSFLALALPDTVDNFFGSVSAMFSDSLPYPPVPDPRYMALIAHIRQVPDWSPGSQALPH